jgi:hypothetical protein
VLLGMDEFPYHQITETFAGVAGSDPQWNDGHYVCAGDDGGNVAFTSNVRLYQNNDVLDGFVCLRHRGRQHNIRLSRRLRTDMDTISVGPLRLEVIEPLQTVRLVLEDQGRGFSLDIRCHTVGVPYMGPIEVNRIEGRLLGERATYEIAGACEGWVAVDGQRYELTTDGSRFFRNHSWGNQAGRGGPRHGAPTPRRRVPGVRQWVLFAMESHSGFYFEDPNGRAAAGRGAFLDSDRLVPVVAVDHDLDFYEGGRRVRSGTFKLTGVDGEQRSYTFEDLGWVYCQGGGYFGGFDDHLGQGVYRGDYHEEGEVWDVSHPTLVVDEEGRSFELDYDWAESFVRLTSGAERGMAHFECVVMTPRR